MSPLDRIRFLFLSLSSRRQVKLTSPKTDPQVCESYAVKHWARCLQQDSAPVSVPKVSEFPRFGLCMSDVFFAVEAIHGRLPAPQGKGFFTSLCTQCDVPVPHFPSILKIYFICVLSKPGLYLINLLIDTKSHLVRGCPFTLCLWPA